MGMDPTRAAIVALGEQREQHQVPMVPTAQGQGVPGHTEQQQGATGLFQAQEQAQGTAQGLIVP
eukprot:6093191-Heterocapsa_arctica.AAC.1